MRNVFFLVLSLAWGTSFAACQSERKQEPSATASSSQSSLEATSDESTSTDDPERGAVAGVVRVSGDSPPVIESIAPKIPVGKCFAAHEAYAKLFREGKGRALADVMIAVTEYEGKPPDTKGDIVIEANDCAYSQRTIAMQVGQRLLVKNTGNEAYTPQLIGNPTQALIIAAPRSDPVAIVPGKVGQYQLVDRTHPHIFADVMVVGYPTVDVTDTEGKFRIENLPAGSAKLNAMLPITGQTVTREIQIRPGETTKVELTFQFDAKKHGEKATAMPDSPQ